jgi:penicillin amidase
VVLRRVIPAAAALLGTSATAAGWYQLFRRPLPKTGGSLEVAGIERPVTIERDCHGVPTVKALNKHDLAFGHGFVHGQDRLFQLELWRRAASGRLSEMLGEEAVQADRLMRTLGLARVASREATELKQDDLDVFAAYAMGVNAAAEAASALPFEHQLLRLEWEPWGVHHSMAMGKMIALGFSTNMEQELLRADLVRAVGPEQAARLEPNYPRGNPVVTAPGTPWDGDGTALAEQIAQVRDLLGLSRQPAGSNNWVVAGSRTATGKPLLAGDPHITAGIPDIWHTVRLEAPGIELQGGAFAGIPGLVIGQSRHMAWTFTNAMADVQDLFIEQIREPENGGCPEYLFEDEWRPVVLHKESIRVRGRDEPVELEVRETHHGPVVNPVLGARGYQPLALAWSALRLPFLPLGLRAGEFRSGRDAVDAFGEYSAPCMNMVWADESGDIGFKLVGRLPVRRSDVTDVPKPGWTGEHEWDGWVPYEEQAAIVNPPSGQIVTANNRTVDDDHPHVTSEWLDGWRAARIEQLLGDREELTLDDFERIPADCFSIPGEATAHRLARLRPAGQREVRALERLRSWDHVMSPDSVAASIYAAFTHHFAKLLSEQIIGDPDLAERWRSRSEAGFTPMNSSPWRWHARLLEIWDEGDWDEQANEALALALDDLEQRHGHDSSKWSWGRVHGIRFGHLFGEGDTRASRAFERLLSRRAPVGGAQETVNAVGHNPYDGDYTGIWGASFRLLADVGSPDRSRWMHFTGQSGHPGSPHYDDLIEPWQAVRSHPFRQPCEHTLELSPQ